MTARSDPSHLTREEFEHAAQKFLGATQQIPPMYSALKRDGEPLYKLARQGLEVERAAREIRIDAITLTDFAPGECELDIVCSKGTYIRTLVEDIAVAAGQVAHLLALRRLEAGPFRAPGMWSLDQLETFSQENPTQLDACLINSAAALAHWPRVTLDAHQAHTLSRGQAVRWAGSLAPGTVAMLDAAGGLLGIGEVDANGLLASSRWMAGTYN